MGVLCRYLGHRWVRCRHCWTYCGKGYASCSRCNAFYKAEEHWHYGALEPAPTSCVRCGAMA